MSSPVVVATVGLLVGTNPKNLAFLDFVGKKCWFCDLPFLLFCFLLPSCLLQVLFLTFGLLPFQPVRYISF